MTIAIAPPKTVMQNPMAPVDVAPFLSGLLLGAVPAGGGEAVVVAAVAPPLVVGSWVIVVWIRVAGVVLGIANEDRLTPTVLHSW
jgi:hypothetical protein